MFRFPQRKTRVVFYFALTVWLAVFAGCATRKQSAASPAAVTEGVNVGEPAPGEFEKRPRPPVRLTSRPRSSNYAAPKTIEEDEWVYRKSVPTQPPLSRFEESILLGQVRASLQKLSEAANVQTVKVQNRTAQLGVSTAVNSASARRIGETLLDQTRLEEVRIKSSL